MNFDLKNALKEPVVLTSPAPWAGHIPFAFWLIPKLKPKVFVELGSYSGISYFAFCESALTSNTAVSCFAVDTWQGDEHAGLYDDNVYNKFIFDNSRYKNFSSAIRSKFDDAVSAFEDKSIDLLHIDGLHTYEAVKHDFESWHPKLSDNAIVLFHDTEVRHSNFGVHKFWCELKQAYTTFEFKHSNGLGVLFLNPLKLNEIVDNSGNGLNLDETLGFLHALGERFELRAKILHSSNLIADLSGVVSDLKKSVKNQGDWINKLDSDILDKSRQITSFQDLLQQHSAKIHSLITENTHLVQSNKELILSSESLKECANKRSSSLEESLKAKNNVIEKEQQKVQENSLLISKLQLKVNSLHREIDDVYASKSWQLTRPLRYANSLKSKVRGSILYRKAKTAASLLAQGRLNDLLTRMRYLLAAQPKQLNLSDFKDKSLANIGIIYTPHTLFLAKLLEKALTKVGLSSILLGSNSADNQDCRLYFVICPQMHHNLPAPERMICFQMEQSVSDRWFTTEYINLLEKSLAVADYSQTNLRYLDKKGILYPHTFYVPVGTYSGYREKYTDELSFNAAVKCQWDVFFYGDVSSPRRQKALDTLKKNFSVRVEKDLFGEALYNAMVSCSVVVNIHFYEGALLETTRLCECLSMGMPVVSESSIDISEHPTLASMISLFPIGDSDAMIQSVRSALLATTKSSQTTSSFKDLEYRFEFFLYRMLFALNAVSFEQFYRNSQYLLNSKSYALSLPETFARRNSFLDISPIDTAIFDGVRRLPGWTGCALSYKFLAKKALEAGQSNLLVMEDDVRFPSSFNQNREAVQSFLTKKTGEWDIFSGLMAKVHPETEVLDVWTCPDSGLIFITIDRMMSMVYNMYTLKSLELISNWDENNLDPNTNTIDQYLQNYPLRVVTTIPFIVDHDVSANSSLWGISNSAYVSLISNAESTLKGLTMRFEDSRAQQQ